MPWTRITDPNHAAELLPVVFRPHDRRARLIWVRQPARRRLGNYGSSSHSAGQMDAFIGPLPRSGGASGSPTISSRTSRMRRRRLALDARFAKLDAEIVRPFRSFRASRVVRASWTTSATNSAKSSIAQCACPPVHRCGSTKSECLASVCFRKFTSSLYGCLKPC